jgi:hypothetical protein
MRTGSDVEHLQLCLHKFWMHGYYYIVELITNKL